MRRLSIAVLVTVLAALCPAYAQTIEDFTAPAPGGHVMAGEVVLPQGATQPVPAVLLISGTGRQSRDFAYHGFDFRPHTAWSEAFNAAGIATIRFDERNTGRSGGDHRTARLQDLVDDAATVLSAASRNPGVDPDRIYVLGHSEGGIIAMMLEGQGAGLAGLVLVGAPGKSGREIILDQALVEGGVSADMTPAQIHAAIVTYYAEQVALDMTRPSMRDHLDLDVPALAAAIDAPVLVIEGGEDWQVTPPQGRALAAMIAEANGGEVSYRLYDGVNHLMSYGPGVTDYRELESLEFDRRVVGDVVDWVRLRAR